MEEDASIHNVDDNSQQKMLIHESGCDQLLHSVAMSDLEHEAVQKKLVFAASAAASAAKKQPLRLKSEIDGQKLIRQKMMENRRERLRIEKSSAEK